jgi:hypothetical protein
MLEEVTDRVAVLDDVVSLAIVLGIVVGAGVVLMTWLQ